MLAYNIYSIADKPKIEKIQKKASSDWIDQRFVYFIGFTEQIALAMIYQFNCFHLFKFINAF